MSLFLVWGVRTTAAVTTTTAAVASTTTTVTTAAAAVSTTTTAVSATVRLGSASVCRFHHLAEKGGLREGSATRSYKQSGPVSDEKTKEENTRTRGRRTTTTQWTERVYALGHGIHFFRYTRAHSSCSPCGPCRLLLSLVLSAVNSWTRLLILILAATKVGRVGRVCVYIHTIVTGVLCFVLV